MANAEDPLARAEKVLETKPYRAYETLSRLFGPVFFGINIVVGLWHLLTTPVPENALSVIIGKAIFFALLRGKNSAKITYALIHLCAVVRALPYRLDRKALFVELKSPGDFANTCHCLFM